MILFVSKQNKDVLDEMGMRNYIIKRSDELGNNDKMFNQFMSNYLKHEDSPYVYLFEASEGERREILDLFQKHCIDQAAKEFEKNFGVIEIPEI